MMHIIGQSIVKVNNDIYESGTHRANEDAFFSKDNLIALSDGAGGVGILANIWAKTLVDNIPNVPFRDVADLDKWIGELWENFYNNNRLKLQGDHWQLKKFENEGSLATLSSLWKINDNEFVYQSYGDSALFIYNSTTGKLNIQENMKSINSFTTNPALINWKVEKHDEISFYEQKISLKNDESIILATDGIAMYIHGAYIVFNEDEYDTIQENKMIKIIDYFIEHQIKDFKLWLNNLLNTLNEKEQFEALMKEWHNDKELPNDDYTLVLVKNKEF